MLIEIFGQLNSTKVLCILNRLSHTLFASVLVVVIIVLAPKGH